LEKGWHLWATIPSDKRRTSGPMFYSHLQTVTGQPAVAGAAGSWNQATGLSLTVSEIFDGEYDAMVDMTLNDL